MKLIIYLDSFIDLYLFSFEDGINQNEQFYHF